MNKCDICQRTFETPQGKSAHMRWVHEGRRPEPRIVDKGNKAWDSLRSQYEHELQLEQGNQSASGKLLAWGFLGWILSRAMQEPGGEGTLFKHSQRKREQRQ